MSEFLEKLFHTTKIKDFAPLFKEAEEKYQNPEAFLNDVAAYLPIRLYEHYYDDSVPHSFFGLISASLVAQSLFPEEARWKPFAQQCWFATKERKRTPLDLDAIESNREGDPQMRWEHFQEAADAGNFKDAATWAKGFLSTKTDRNFFRQKSLAYAMEDTFQGGHKFLYLFQAWRLAEALKWNHVEKIICPALHFLVVAPKDQSLSQRVREFWRQSPLSSFLENTGQISIERYDEVEAALLFSEGMDEALHALKTLADAGVSLEAAYEVVLLAAAQALSNSKAADWIWPMRAFHFSYSLQQSSHLDEKTYALMMAASLLQQASVRSRELEHNRELDELARKLVPVDPFSVLRTVVSHTDPYASATAVFAILGMEDSKKNELFQMLSSLAVKNDGDVCYGHDILFIHEAVDCYRRFHLVQSAGKSQQWRLEPKDKLPISAGFFLGRTTKRYELFGTYKD